MALEFRVRWRREGRQQTTRIYQGWDAAIQKMRGIQTMDEIKHETEKYKDMPDLAEPPVLEFREVGAWQTHSYQPKATDLDRERMRDLFSYYGYDRAAEPGEVPF